MEIRDVLALNLRKARQAKDLSQEELAHRADIDRTYISALERSVYAAGIDVVDRLARVLDLEAADLLRKPASARGANAAARRKHSQSDDREL
jgi:transcriptional regulator with XRE-family HTH domain